MPKDEAFSGYSDDQLIMLNTDVYGLVSGPAWWRRSFLEVLVKELGYRTNPYDRCVLTLDAEEQVPTRGAIVIEVDDVLEAGDEEHRRRMKVLEEKLRFGKAVELQSEDLGATRDVASDRSKTVPPSREKTKLRVTSNMLLDICYHRVVPPDER